MNSVQLEMRPCCHKTFEPDQAPCFHLHALLLSSMAFQQSNEGSLRARRGVGGALHLQPHD